MKRELLASRVYRYALYIRSWLLHEKLKRELQERHNTILVHVTIVRKNETRVNTLMHRLEIVRELMQKYQTQ